MIISNNGVVNKFLKNSYIKYISSCLIICNYTICDAFGFNFKSSYLIGDAVPKENEDSEEEGNAIFIFL